MRSMTWTLLAIAFVALVAAPVMAQDIRSGAMGETAVGLADGSDAFWYNPAGLPFITVHGQDMYGSTWRGIVSGTASLDINTDDMTELDSAGLFGGDESRYEIDYAGRPVDMGWGIGAGWFHEDFGPDNYDVYGAGFGFALDQQREFSLGAAVFHESNSDDTTSFDIGGMWHSMDQQMNTWRVGVVATDVSEEYGNMYWRAGASVTTPMGLVLAGDLFDVTDEFDSHFNFGVEYPYPLSSAVVIGRAGLLDGDPTVGISYRQQGWEIGVSYEDLDGWQETDLGVIGYF